MFESFQFKNLEYFLPAFYYLQITYLLVLFQTNPTYLAKLIFQMPQNKSTKFMDSVIFTLYNYASNQREEYLLLRLFKTALQEEIKYEWAAADQDLPATIDLYSFRFQTLLNLYLIFFFKAILGTGD